MKINKEELFKSFREKFTYPAGDGDRMNTSPKIPQMVFDYFIRIMEAYEYERTFRYKKTNEGKATSDPENNSAV